MKNPYKILALVLLVIPSIVSSQIDRETRAVWVASNFRLDWPPASFDPVEQKNALIKIFNNIEQKNLNTIYFQVRFNCTVLFNSSYEPWTHYLTGIAGGIPAYDPLQFAIEEAHKRGLEIHAWVNMVRAFNGSEQQIFDYPSHVTNIHSNWVRTVREGDQETYWLDPGLPEVQKYLSNVVLEIAEQYDVDGIHLDFIRYPVNTFDDSFAYSVYGEGKPKDDWRRDNITNIVRTIKNGIDQFNPDIKFGVTPIGIYQNIEGARGLQSYSEIYQDSRAWLRDKLIDYVVPQIYWDFENNPKFDLLVNDWVKNSYERNVVIGIASYKDDVKPQTGRMINYVKSSGAEGVAFFRYSFIKNDNYFDVKALPSPMFWKDKEAPIAPVNLHVDIVNKREGIFQMTWMLPELMPGTEDVKYYALFNMQNKFDNLSSKSLFKIIPSDRASLSFSLKRPRAVYNYFAVKSLDRFWNESTISSNVVTGELPKLVRLTEKVGLKDDVVLSKNNCSNYSIIITSVQTRSVSISLYPVNASVRKLVKQVSSGINIFEFDEDNLNSVEVEFSGGKTLKLNL